MATTPAATPVNKAARFRKIAEDTSLPQAVRNEYLDKANAIEKEAAKPTMAKGGVVKPPMGAKPPAKKLPMPAMAKGGAVAKKTDTYKDANSAVKGAKKRGEPSVSFMIAVGKPKEKMAKGGMAKKKC